MALISYNQEYNFKVNVNDHNKPVVKTCYHK